jgi:hypothetical protein
MRDGGDEFPPRTRVLTVGRRNVSEVIPMVEERDALQQKLEVLLDENGRLAAIGDALAMVCFAKSEHLKSTWHDKLTASAWSDAGGRIVKLASKLDI